MFLYVVFQSTQRSFVQNVPIYRLLTTVSRKLFDTHVIIVLLNYLLLTSGHAAGLQKYKISQKCIFFWFFSVDGLYLVEYCV